MELRIALVSDSYFPTKDGVVVSVEILRKALESLGHTVFVIAPDPGEKDRIDGVKYFPSIGFKSYPGYYVPIFPSNKIEIIKELNVDVIHIHGIAVMALKAMVAAYTLKIPTVVTFHTMVGDTMKYYSPIKMSPETADKLVWLYLRNLLKIPNAVIFPTKPIYTELINDKGCKFKRAEIIPTGVDTSHFATGMDGTSTRKRLSAGNRKVILVVGRISYEKNIDMLIRSMVELKDDALLVIVGKGPAQEDLEKLTDELDLRGSVVFAGYAVDNALLEYYAAADVIASASRFETQGLSILEGISCGLPAVCCNARAFTDIIIDGDNGYLFDDETDCASALKKGINADDHMRKRARETAEEYSIPSSVSKIISLYEDVISKKEVN